METFLADEAKVLRYQLRAAEMLVLEKAAQDDDAKRLYRTLAGQWSKMAEVSLSENARTKAALAEAELVFLE